MKNKWRDTFIFQVYKLALEGFNKKECSKKLGVTPTAFQKWFNQKEVFREAYIEGRRDSQSRGKSGQKFFEYVFERLPQNLKDLWNQIHADENIRDSPERLEKILGRAGVLARMQLFIHALVYFNFNMSKACSSVNVSKRTVEGWKVHYPGFTTLLEEIHWHRKNFYEDALVDLIKKGEPQAIIYANKTINQDRGYNDKKELDVNIKGTIEHQHTEVDDLKLPLGVRRELLKALRAKQEKEETAKIGYAGIPDAEYEVVPPKKKRMV